MEKVYNNFLEKSMFYYYSKADFEKCYGKDAVKMVKNTKLTFDPYLLLNKGNIFK